MKKPLVNRDSLAGVPQMRSLELQIPDFGNSVLHNRGRNLTAPSLGGHGSTSPRSVAAPSSNAAARPRAATIDPSDAIDGTQIPMMEVRRHGAPPPGHAPRSPSHRQPTCGLSSWGDGEEPKRGLQGCTPRHHSSRSAGAAAVPAIGLPFGDSPGAGQHISLDSLAPSTIPRAASGGGTIVPTESIAADCCGFPTGADGSCGERGGAAGVGVGGGVGGVAGGASAMSSGGGLSCVPFPSMRHAHHLSTVTRASGGSRFPPTAPASRDESAVNRVSNFSIRPCIHDAELSQRFGAKASCRAAACGASHSAAGVASISGLSEPGRDSADFEAGVRGNEVPRRDEQQQQGSSASPRSARLPQVQHSN